MIKLQSIKRVRRRFRLDPSCVLYLPLQMLDGSTFMSRDHYGHLCTVTGALWTPQGRSFDGTDDFIRVLDSAAIQNIFDPPGGTVLAWINPASDGQGDMGSIWDKGKYAILTTSESAGFVKLRFLQNFTTTTGDWITTNRVVPINQSSLVVVSYNNGSVDNDPIMSINGNPVPVTETTTPVGTRGSDVASHWFAGNYSALTRTYHGIQHEQVAVRGMMSQQEILNYYLATKGRYGR